MYYFISEVSPQELGNILEDIHWKCVPLSFLASLYNEGEDGLIYVHKAGWLD